MQILLNFRWCKPSSRLCHLAFVIFLGMTLTDSVLAGDNTYKPFQHFKDCDTCSEMVVLPAGQFMMGATDEEAKDGDKVDKVLIEEMETPRHWVQVKSFAIAKFDVTREQFALFALMTGFKNKACEIFTNTPPAFVKQFGKRNWFSPDYANWDRPGFQQTAQDPVVCVSWNDAQKYIAWLNSTLGSKTKHHYRLPTEAEWEYAARAGTVTPNYWGGVNSPEQCKFANGRDMSAKNINPDVPHANCDDHYLNTSPVGSFQPNAWGLYDMLGNVEQWTQDCWHESYADSLSTGPASGIGDCTNREIKGGGWPAEPMRIRSARRGAAVLDYRWSDLGFRLAVDIKNSDGGVKP